LLALLGHISLGDDGFDLLRELNKNKYAHKFANFEFDVDLPLVLDRAVTAQP